MTEPWDTIKTTYDAQLLRTLTNSNNPGASSINDTIGNKAAAFAREEFAMETGVSYNSATASHNSVIYELVIYILQTWANKLGESADKRRELVYGRLKKFSQTRGGRKRVTVATSSPDVPTDDTRNGTIPSPLPEFDVSRFDRVSPNDPNSGGTDSFPTHL